MRLGILGGGQLALMLTEAAHKLGHTVTIVSQPDEPAVSVADETIAGSIRDPEAVEALFRAVDVITIENELLDMPLIREFEGKYPQVRFLPATSAVAITQDKLSQKQLFERCGLGSAAYVPLSRDVQRAELEAVAQRLGCKVVLKWSKGGYDGRGVLVWAASEDPSPALTFWARGVESGTTVFAEACIPFQGEVAMVAVRDGQGQFAYWPLMFTRQSEGTCREVYGPAVRMGLDVARQLEAERAATAIGNELGFCGVFAIEFFLTNDGLLVNEMAPRVHNSGHFTLSGDEESQFAAHVRAVTNTPLVHPAVDEYAYMWNLLAPERPEFDARRLVNVPPPGGAALHWYGKATAKPRRKMGHVTARCASVEALRQLSEQVCVWEQHFWTAQERASEGDNQWQG